MGFKKGDVVYSKMHTAMQTSWKDAMVVIEDPGLNYIVCLHNGRPEGERRGGFPKEDIQLIDNVTKLERLIYKID